LIHALFHITLTALVDSGLMTSGRFAISSDNLRTCAAVRIISFFAIDSVTVTMSKHAEDDNEMPSAVVIRECTSIDDFEQCLALQREVFGFAETEISPRRHFIVSRRAGGWVLGAFVRHDLVGFVHQLVAIHEKQIYGYSHMLAVKPSYQNIGVGARLKWAQRARTLAEGVSLIRWTWDPMQVRNAHFNLNRLGVVVRSYAANFYGTDYGVPPSELEHAPGIDSDRLIAEWQVNSERVDALAERSTATIESRLSSVSGATIAIPPNWSNLIKDDPVHARREQLRVRKEFEKAFASGLVCSRFERNALTPRYLLYEE
jgi:predicted GNAT superfamily acetyltransferase